MTFFLNPDQVLFMLLVCMLYRNLHAYNHIIYESWKYCFLLSNHYSFYFYLVFLFFVSLACIVYKFRPYCVEAWSFDFYGKMLFLSSETRQKQISFASGGHGTFLAHLSMEENWKRSQVKTFILWRLKHQLFRKNFLNSISTRNLMTLKKYVISK